MRPPAPGADDISQQQDKAQIIAQRRTQRRARETHAQGKRKQPSQHGVDRGADDENNHADVTLALGLQKSLERFKGGISREADEAVAQEGTRLHRQLGLLEKVGQKPRRRCPDDTNGNARNRHEEPHPLDMQPHANQVARSVRLRTQGVECRGHAFENRETNYIHGHDTDTLGREVVWTQMARDDRGDDKERVLQEVGGDQRQ